MRKPRTPLDPEMFDELCPSALSPLRFGDKWAPLVLTCLEDGPRRFSELRVPLRGATAKTLTQSLRCLERYGLVSRIVHSGTTRHVEYALTELGRGLLGPLRTLFGWIGAHWDELLDAYESYDRRAADLAGADRAGTG